MADTTTILFAFLSRLLTSFLLVQSECDGHAHPLTRPRTTLSEWVVRACAAVGVGGDRTCLATVHCMRDGHVAEFFVLSDFSTFPAVSD